MKNSVNKSIHVPAAAAIALILSLAAGSPAQAQSGPTPQEQMACRSDAGKFCVEHTLSRGPGDQAPWLAFSPDSNSPRLGHFPDSLFDRLELLLTGLLQTALVGPLLSPFRAPFFGVRPFDVGVAGSGEGIPRHGGLFVGLFGRFRRLRLWLYGLRGRTVVGGLLFGAGRIG